MTHDDGRPKFWGDIVLSVFVVIGATLLFVGAADLPPPRFEPLGSAALPRILGGLLYGFGALVGGRAAIGLLRRRPGVSDPAAVRSEGKPYLALYVFVLLCAFVAALDFFRAPFVPSSAVFLGLVGFGLSGWDPYAGAVYTVIGLGIGFALAYVFANFLYISFG